MKVDQKKQDYQPIAIILDSPNEAFFMVETINYVYDHLVMMHITDGYRGFINELKYKLDGVKK